MEKFTTEEDWAKLACWLQTNPSPRFQADLDTWTALSVENDAIMKVWKKAKLSSRTADAEAPTIDEIWPEIKSDLGIRSQKSKGRKRTKDKSSKKQRYYQTAWFMGIASMIFRTKLCLTTSVLPNLTNSIPSISPRTLWSAPKPLL